jgi:glutathione S-transferase
MFGGKTDQAIVDDNLEKLAAKLDVYDQILAKQKYLAGDVCTFELPSNESI